MTHSHTAPDDIFASHVIPECTRTDETGIICNAAAVEGEKEITRARVAFWYSYPNATEDEVVLVLAFRTDGGVAVVRYLIGRQYNLDGTLCDC